jgi:hypothetical protein
VCSAWRLKAFATTFALFIMPMLLAFALTMTPGKC